MSDRKKIKINKKTPGRARKQKKVRNPMRNVKGALEDPVRQVKLTFAYRASPSVRTVMKTFSKNGLAYVFRKFPILRKQQPLDRGVRFRKSLEELGPTYIKHGQMPPTRFILLSADSVDELTKLQYNVPPENFQVIDMLLQEAYGDYSKYFKKVEKKPLASASMASVRSSDTGIFSFGAYTGPGTDVVSGTGISWPGNRPANRPLRNSSCFSSSLARNSRRSMSRRFFTPFAIPE